jgi:TRAP-type C4-dicarboxylate transport system permease small subunit
MLQYEDKSQVLLFHLCFVCIITLLHYCYKLVTNEFLFKTIVRNIPKEHGCGWEKKSAGIPSYYIARLVVFWVKIPMQSFFGKAQTLNSELRKPDETAGTPKGIKH